MRKWWFTLSIVVFSVAVGVLQFWIQKKLGLGPWVMTTLVAGSLAAIGGFVLLLLRLRVPIEDFKYRLLTRDVDRAMQRGVSRRNG
jgi:hypothetical protein